MLTLQDYSAICAHFGSMVTRLDRQPCPAASPAACARCYPQREPADFYLRGLYLRRFLDQVDRFVAPTGFLRQRYAEWGLPEAKITVLSGSGTVTPVEPRAADGILRMGWFGELSPLHGLGVLVETARLLEGKGNIVFELHGDTRAVPPELRPEAEALLARAGRNLRACGRYDAESGDALMRGVDAVMVPSLGWDAPSGVIEAALRNRRPVICSDSGGMAEQVREGVDGFRFPAGDAPALARLLERLAALPHKLRELATGLRAPPTLAEVAEQHIALYRDAGAG